MIEEVWLYRVGRNLNRAYRTAEAFGCRRLVLVECDAVLSGHLYAARGRVEVIKAERLPETRILALETWGAVPLNAVAEKPTRLLLGGETSGLPRQMRGIPVARIPMAGRSSGLTVEAALAIALYHFSQEPAHG